MIKGSGSSCAMGCEWGFPVLSRGVGELTGGVPVGILH